ncbi:hypothetical protein BD310DRAFT_770441, partial [Dichomitus squalens]
PRKTTQWPSQLDLKGAKYVPINSTHQIRSWLHSFSWVYMRKWYTDAIGMLEAFEAHYKTLSPSDRR